MCIHPICRYHCRRALVGTRTASNQRGRPNQIIGILSNMGMAQLFFSVLCVRLASLGATLPLRSCYVHTLSDVV